MHVTDVVSDLLSDMLSDLLSDIISDLFSDIVTLRILLKPIQHLLCFINHIAIALYDNDFVKCLKSRLFFSTSMFTDMVNEA
jgi:hypothetical protein